MTMLAYHNDPAIKDAILVELGKHRKADALMQGYGYWKDGKGCAVGCTLKSGNHVEYETRFGIPQMLAHLEDTIFEGLPVEKARAWPEAFMGAVKPGSDLSKVGWQFLHWLLTDKNVNPGIDHPLVRDAVKQCADVLAVMAKGLPVDAARAAAAAARAADAAYGAAYAAKAAARAARAAHAAADAAYAAAYAAKAAARAARAAHAAADAAYGAYGARAAGAYVLMSEKIIELLEAA